MERPEFCPSREDVEQGFGQIVNPIICPEEVKQEALQLFDEGLCSGDPRAEAEAIEQTIGATAWHWPWFEEWQAKFAQMGRWPYMWQDLMQVEPMSDYPSTIEQAGEILLVNQMRQLLQAAGETKLPRSRNEMVDRFIQVVPFSAAQVEVEARLQAEMAEHKKHCNRELCKLLAHTIMMRICHSRDHQLMVRQMQNNPECSWWLKLSSSGCDVEDEIAAGLIGEVIDGTIPPFFPGDRSSFYLKRAHDK